MHLCSELDHTQNLIPPETLIEPPLLLWDALSPQGRTFLQEVSQLAIDVSFTSEWELVNADVNVLINRSQEGDAEAQYLLGICYHRGLGVVRDVKQAMKNYAKAAERGHVDAQFNLDYCYANGEGVDKNEATADVEGIVGGIAAKWFSKAAEQGHADVEYALRESKKPMDVSGYNIVKKLPKELEGELPSIEEIAQLIDTM